MIEIKGKVALALGPHTYTLGMGYNVLISQRFITESLEKNLFPVRVVQAAYDVYGLDGIALCDDGFTGSLNSHEDHKVLGSGLKMSYGNFELVFKNKRKLSSVIRRDNNYIDALIESGLPEKSGLFMGLRIEQL